MKNHLYFGVEEKYTGDGYGPYIRIRFGSPEKMVAGYVEHLVRRAREMPYIFISTMISRNWLWWTNKHILVLDCDGVGDMAAACHWLKTVENIRYEVIESTPGKFWVVTDHIANWKQTWHCLKQIPGVCDGFRYGSVQQHKQIGIRAFPKLVNGKPHAPVFPDKINLSPAAAGWLEDVKDYFDSDLFERVSKAVRLVDKLDKNAMEILAADPNFLV